ncbi:8-oxoguanine glycosylase ogg1 [Coemansia javaensis]|uniref:DNA-(apurinic or apyrimidinic site) lyase n=1 Tax=Coemansia javaensis TaxID=2761396 RepID=A0A9W8LJW5_9FUNG|nr:8-oxoguanine glycosylase ogg1 [Coemansia javaensis]
MTVPDAPEWEDLCVAASELRLDPTLSCGQAFRWQATGPCEWTCALWGCVVDLKQTDSSVLFRVLGTHPGASGDIAGALRDYFQLQTSVVELCERWALVDSGFSGWRAADARILRQPVAENLLTFIASSNNNIKRITMLVARLCERYGAPIDTAKGRFFTCPSIADIARDPDVAATLRALGFGYRAQYYAKTVGLLCAEHPGDDGPERFLEGLRGADAAAARAALMRLPGVGPKVADCVCLMSLDKPGTVPIDTHMWQVAQRRYVPKIATFVARLPQRDSRAAAADLGRQLRAAKAPGARQYAVAQQLFVLLFGPFAGWAQGLLFSGDLDRKRAEPPADPATPPPATATTTTTTKRRRR